MDLSHSFSAAEGRDAPGGAAGGEPQLDGPLQVPDHGEPPALPHRAAGEGPHSDK